MMGQISLNFGKEFWGTKKAWIETNLPDELQCAFVSSASQRQLHPQSL